MGRGGGGERGVCEDDYLYHRMVDHSIFLDCRREHTLNPFESDTKPFRRKGKAKFLFSFRQQLGKPTTKPYPINGGPTSLIPGS